ncbi:MAG TPA: hypothetical protein VGD56_17225, partial [Gemmatirosa sp.]
SSDQGLSGITEAGHTSDAGTLRLPLQDQIALRLGRVAMRFAAAEAMTRHIAVRVLDVADEDVDKFEAVLAELPFRKLRATLVAAVRHPDLDPDVLRSLRTAMRELEAVEEQRNVLTHSAWDHSKLPSQMARVKVRVSSAGEFRADEEVIADLAALDAFVDRVHNAGAAVSRWYMHEYLGVQHPEQPG